MVYVSFNYSCSSSLTAIAAKGIPPASDASTASEENVKGSGSTLCSASISGAVGARSSAGSSCIWRVGKHNN